MIASSVYGEIGVLIQIVLPEKINNDQTQHGETWSFNVEIQAQEMTQNISME